VWRTSEVSNNDSSSSGRGWKSGRTVQAIGMMIAQTMDYYPFEFEKVLIQDEVLR